MRNSWMLAIILGLGLAGPGQAQEEEDGAPPDDMAVAAAVAAQTGRGPVTNLPLPRYVSLKGSEGNARRGPSLSHRIDWVFTHAGMPLRVTAEFGHWRRVEDRDGAGGWVHYSLISGVRTVIVEEDMTELHVRADPSSAVAALAEAGAIAKLGDCTRDWCEISADTADGWVPKTAIWGVSPEELRD
ncbi:SH3 domain-containing protein [Paenirhodobacter sp. CAU 1674]|jgi:SH3-like domain-containing protein|uniref:SH3 domain-containing protein n=1 Tax=Paenirhodobacter sp. CAU 1674 TaxID=3032596 RepID=UPI0023DC51AB|nr:SH3 domain-containing protein [Paenirhodobacter sp. CAU 1674]MDF2141556.1 SH3 domain-containing protein [Paenirhodobacter sp. CAU 1674]